MVIIVLLHVVLKRLLKQVVFFMMIYVKEASMVWTLIHLGIVCKTIMRLIIVLIVISVIIWLYGMMKKDV